MIWIVLEGLGLHSSGALWRAPRVQRGFSGSGPGLWAALWRSWSLSRPSVVKPACHHTMTMVLARALQHLIVNVFCKTRHMRQDLLAVQRSHEAPSGALRRQALVAYSTYLLKIARCRQRERNRLAPPSARAAAPLARSAARACVHRASRSRAASGRSVVIDKLAQHRLLPVPPPASGASAQRSTARAPSLLCSTSSACTGRAGRAGRGYRELEAKKRWCSARAAVIRSSAPTASAQRLGRRGRGAARGRGAGERLVASGGGDGRGGPPRGWAGLAREGPAEEEEEEVRPPRHSAPRSATSCAAPF